MTNEQPKVILFGKCPVCGSKERYCESLGNQEKARGHMRKELTFCLQVIDGACIDKGLETRLPMGTNLPAYRITTDICMGYPTKPCGTIYVTSITEEQLIKKPNIVLPGPRNLPFGGMNKAENN